VSSEANWRNFDFRHFRLHSRNRRFLTAGEWILLAVLLALFVRYGFLRGWHTLNTDFPNYYVAASIHRLGIPLDRAYEWTWFQRQNDHLGAREGIVAFAPNPPLCVLPILPLTTLPALAAKRVWLILNLGFLALALWVLCRVTTLRWVRVAGIALLCVVPLYTNFWYGQYYVLVLLLISGAYCASYLGHRFTSGMLLAIAAMLKLFPAVFLVLLIWKRDWRSVAGFILGAAGLAAISVSIFGWEVHRVFLIQVLPQSSRGEWLAPYILDRNSFFTLWSHLFLFEPELNPSPLLNSPVFYALAQAVTTTALLFGFFLSSGQSNLKRPVALEWAAFVPLLLLLSSTTGSYHPSVLIFTAVVGFDALLKTADTKKALVLLALYMIACVPVPAALLKFFPLTRLLATLALYILFVHALSGRRSVQGAGKWAVAALIVFALLTTSNLRALRNRSEDFARRLPSQGTGDRAANPVATAAGIVFTDMQRKGYGAVLLQGREIRNLPLVGDVLSIGGASSSPVAYFELTGHQSSIVRVAIEPLGSTSEVLTEGQDPVVAPNGKWLAFIREEQGRSSAWLLATGSQDAPQMVLQSAYHPLDLTVTSEGDLIAAVGRVSEPHLVVARRATQLIETLPWIRGPVRYPSISPDGKRLAFSRRELGHWHLMVRELATGVEDQLTHASCDAISASWENAQTLLYAADCGRGVGLSAVARVVLPASALP